MTRVDTSKWKEFKIGDLFESSNGNIDIQQSHINNKGTYVITAGEQNNGVMGRSDIEALVFPKNTITLDMFGNAYYRDFEYKMVTHARVFSLKSKVKMDGKIGLFFVAYLNKYKNLFSYNNMCSWNKIKELTIKLPVIEAEEIDYGYMEKYISELEAERISELEAERISELEAYLTVTGLNDYELSEEDKAVLSLSSKRAFDEEGTLEDSSEDEVRFGEFDITEVFTIKNTKCIMQNQIVPNSGNIPYVTAGEDNNAISTYIDCPIEWIDDGNCVFIGGKTLVITYQEKNFCSNDSHNLALYLKNEEYQNGYVYRYMIGTLKSALSHKYYWGDSISRKKIQNDKILLPIKSDGTPNFDYMERYIKAMEKLVIADVVKYKDRVIAETKKIVNQ